MGTTRLPAAWTSPPGTRQSCAACWRCPPCVPLHFVHSATPATVVVTPGSASAAFAVLRAELAEARHAFACLASCRELAANGVRMQGVRLRGKQTLSIACPKIAVLVCCAKCARLLLGARSSGERPAKCARGAAARTRALAGGHLRHGPAAGAVRGRAVSPGRPSELRGPGCRARGGAGGRRAGYAPHD